MSSGATIIGAAALGLALWLAAPAAAETAQADSDTAAGTARADTGTATGRQEANRPASRAAERTGPVRAGTRAGAPGVSTAWHFSQPMAGSNSGQWFGGGLPWQLSHARRVSRVAQTGRLSPWQVGTAQRPFSMVPGSLGVPSRRGRP